MLVELNVWVLRYREGSSDKVYIGVNSPDVAAAFYGKTCGTLQKTRYEHGKLQDKLDEKTHKGYVKDDFSLLSDAQKRQIKGHFADAHGVTTHDVFFASETRQPAQPKTPDPKIEQKRAETYGDW